MNSSLKLTEVQCSFRRFYSQNMSIVSWLLFKQSNKDNSEEAYSLSLVDAGSIKMPDVEPCGAMDS